MEAMKLEAMKQEAIERMKILKIYPNAVRDFKKKARVINKSEGYGALYWLNDEEEKIIKQFEEEQGAMVYACILNYLEFGECLSILFVPKDEEEWQMDREDLMNGYAFAYVYNKTCPDCSEFGTIGIRPSFGGLIRTA